MFASAGTDRTPRPWIWASLFVINMALIAAARIFDILEPPATFILIAFNMLLLVPMTREARRAQEQKGAMSPALRVYNRRLLTFGVIYMVAMIGGGNMFSRLEPDSPWLWLLAIVPLAPVMGMIWSMYRYYREESDEFLRHRAVTGALVGLVMVLVLGTAWGFLEMFGLVGHMWNWWVFPVWAIGLACGMCWPRSGTTEVSE